MLRARLSLIALVVAIGMPLPSLAVPMAYLFTGNCSDCAAAADVDTWLVKAALTVTDDYVPGSNLSVDDFVSFEYGLRAGAYGLPRDYVSNLVEPFALTAADWRGAKNRILNGVLPGASDFKLRLVNAASDVWTCTELGSSVSRSAASCAHTDKVFFSVSKTGEWSFGAPPKDVGNNGAFGAAVAAPEPTTLSLLVLAGAGAAFGRSRLSGRAG